MASGSRTLKALITKNSLKERFKVAQTYLSKLKVLVEDPQHSLPDIFIWMVSSGKRLAYLRLPSRDLIYASSNNESGKFCAELQTLFLKWPGKKASGAGGWAIPAKLNIYLWLGLLNDKKSAISGVPLGYDITNEIRNMEKPNCMLPSSIHYSLKHVFQLRAHIYQARSLIGSDASGLSDPFARILFYEFSKTTQVIDETLSPTWDELLVFDEIIIYGSMEDIKLNPPTIVIEIFDQDKVGKSEFIGRAYARPRTKPVDQPYTKPHFPPALEWFDLTRGSDYAGELLATFELLEIKDSSKTNLPDLPDCKEISLVGALNNVGPIFPVPMEIRPTLAKYRIEVLFWGLRNLKRVHLLTVDKPRVDIECAGHIMSSSVIQNTKRNPNFVSPVRFIEIELPEQELYRPPLTIRVVDCRSFGRFTLVGTHIINSVHKYMFNPISKTTKEVFDKPSVSYEKNTTESGNNNNVIEEIQFAQDNEKFPLLLSESRHNHKYGANLDGDVDKKSDSKKRKQCSESCKEDDMASKDWWTKYFASVEDIIEKGKIAKRNKLSLFSNTAYFEHFANSEDFNWTTEKTFSEERKNTKGSNKCTTKQSLKAKGKLSTNALHKVYLNELEANPEFNEFKDWLLSFELYRGKKTGDEVEDENRIVGYFKGAIKLYKSPLPKYINHPAFVGVDSQNGYFQKIPSNDPIHVLVRVYIIKANDLHPMDLNGKADPYVVLQLGCKRISDKDHYISKQLNPVFGKCFEIEATFPQESLLTIQILDWDLVGTDDMIGETRIDLENRFYSRHRATCGLSRKYEEQGYNRWRDAMKPVQILSKLCKDLKLDPPIYEFGRVKVGTYYFLLDTNELYFGKNTKTLEENMALAVLHRWHEFPVYGFHLVPEHTETRPLYKPNKPGIEQGKLELWVDMFPMDMPLPGPPTDISPRKPKSFELRIIIWNTDEVVLEDDAFFTGEKMSDIYVKGWLKGLEDCQQTDIHYRSLTGEGNFNWRFIYPFDYLVAEEKIVISRKESMFSWDETESKIPARLELQVWDADHFSADDFLGAVTLDLNRFPRGAKSSKLCTLNMLKMDGSVPTVNIFKQKRVKGWWPFYVKKENDVMQLTGKVEAEIHLLAKEEAEKNPAGIGRNDPDPLDKPNRPDASFMWILNPIKSIRYILWHNYKWRIIKCLAVVGLLLLLFLFFYAIPGYTVKMILGA